MITIIQAPEKPISLMGGCASICYGKSSQLNLYGTEEYNRGWDCVNSRHGRVMEFPDIIIRVDGYSARVIRELYTHIIGVTRLQESTRYMDMSEFEYYTPPSIMLMSERSRVYHQLMTAVKATYNELLELGVPKEDAANVLPLGSNSSIVLKINFRALLHMGEERHCSRAYREFRALMSEIVDTVSEYSEEWAELMGMMKPKCDYLMFCPEKKSCGRYPKREDVARERGLD
jgi:thymidylate synthase (FAD)